MDPHSSALQTKGPRSLPLPDIPPPHPATLSDALNERATEFLSPWPLMPVRVSAHAGRAGTATVRPPPPGEIPFRPRQVHGPHETLSFAMMEKIIVFPPRLVNLPSYNTVSSRSNVERFTPFVLSIRPFYAASLDHHIFGLDLNRPVVEGGGFSPFSPSRVPPARMSRLSPRRKASPPAAIPPR